MTRALLVGLASGIGAVARYLLDRAVARRCRSRFPLGTLAVNVSGSLLLGLVAGWSLHHGLAAGPTVVLSAGFCAGFTTWSTFAYETVALADAGAVRSALLNVTVSLAVGLGAAAAGLGLSRLG